MNKNRRWTKEEDQILAQAIMANPQNLKRAFKIASEKLSRTEKAVEFRWYSTVKKQSLCFVTVSPTKKLRNGKNYSPINSLNAPTSIKKTIWTRLKVLLGLK